MKKIFIIAAILCITFALPALALKNISAFKWDVPVDVEITDVSHALQARVKFKDKDPNYPRTRVTVYVSNLNCHEFTRMRIHKSTKENISKRSENYGRSYLRPSNLSVKKDSRAGDYVISLFRQYPDNIKLSIHGYGILNNLVGEFYINGVSLNRHLIEKGYCAYLQ